MKVMPWPRLDHVKQWHLERWYTGLVRDRAIQDDAASPSFEGKVAAKVAKRSSNPRSNWEERRTHDAHRGDKEKTICLSHLSKVSTQIN